MYTAGHEDESSDSDQDSNSSSSSSSSHATAKHEEVRPLLSGRAPMINGSRTAAPTTTMVAMTSALETTAAAASHCHRSGDPDRVASRLARRQLALACLLCFLFVVGELVGGYYSGSLAIMADAAHMFSDFASFGVSLFVIWLSGRKPKKT